MIMHLIGIRLYAARLMPSVAPLRPRGGVKHTWQKETKCLTYNPFVDLVSDYI